jgi:hypothetical protein
VQKRPGGPPWQRRGPGFKCSYYLSMILTENRFPLFGIMLVLRALERCPARD